MAYVRLGDKVMPLGYLDEVQKEHLKASIAKQSLLKRLHQFIEENQLPKADSQPPRHAVLR